MTPCQEKILKLLLRTASGPTELTFEKLAQIRSELKKERAHVQEDWGGNRLLFIHTMIECLREGTRLDTLVDAWWPVLMEQLEHEWVLVHPVSRRKVRLTRVFRELKLSYERRINVH